MSVVTDWAKLELIRNSTASRTKFIPCNCMGLMLCIQEYAKDPVQNWKSKDSALYLVTSLASKGMTQKVNDTVSFYIDYL